MMISWSKGATHPTEKQMEQFSAGRQIFSGALARSEGPVVFQAIRELEAADLVIREVSSSGVIIPKIKALRASHHKLAHVLAMGLSNEEASLMTGYSPNRVSMLLSDPAFKDLLAYYKDNIKDVFVDVTQRMASFATNALEVLQERLEDKPDGFSNKELNELIKTTADRGGHSPVQKTETKNITLTAEDLLKIKQEVESKQNGSVRRINQLEEAERVKERLSEGPGPVLGLNDNRPAGVPGKATETPGEPGQGDKV